MARVKIEADNGKDVVLILIQDGNRSQETVPAGTSREIHIEGAVSLAEVVELLGE